MTVRIGSPALGDEWLLLGGETSMTAFRLRIRRDNCRKPTQSRLMTSGRPMSGTGPQETFIVSIELRQVFERIGRTT